MLSFMRLYDGCTEENGQDDSNGNDRVKAIQETAVTGENPSVVLDAVVTLDEGHGQVTDHGDHCSDETYDGHEPYGQSRTPFHQPQVVIQQSKTYEGQHAEYDAANGTFHSLLGADVGDELVLSEQNARKVCKGIGDPGTDKGQRR